jgi:hypothetical protein
MSSKVETTDLKTAPGVTLDEKQKLLVGSVLDVYPGTILILVIPRESD